MYSYRTLNCYARSANLFRNHVKGNPRLVSHQTYDQRENIIYWAPRSFTGTF
jgi:hypothetical protein